MGPWFVVAMAVTGYTPTTVEAEGVQITATLEAHIFTWEVTNLGALPIASFEIAVHRSSTHRVPEGWELAFTRHTFRAWATEPRYAIQPGRSSTFSSRVGVAGVVLGAVPASVGVGVGTEDRLISFDKVWGPVPKRRSMVVLVALTLCGIVALHTVLLVRRRCGRPAAGDPTGDAGPGRSGSTPP